MAGTFTEVEPGRREATLATCQLILRGVTEADYHRPTVCPEFDVAQLADHLIGTVTFLGTAAFAGAGSGAGATPGLSSPEPRVAAAAQATGQQAAVSIH